MQINVLGLLIKNKVKSLDYKEKKCTILDIADTFIGRHSHRGSFRDFHPRNLTIGLSVKRDRSLLDIMLEFDET